MSEQSGFDAALSAAAGSGRAPTLLQAIRQGQTAALSGHVAVETVFTSNGLSPLMHVGEPGSLNFTRTVIGEIDVALARDDDGTYGFGAFPTAFPGVYHIASGQPQTNARWKRLDTVVYNSGEVSRCFLDARDFLAISERLGRFDELAVSRLTARKRTDHSSIGRGFPENGQGPRPTPHEAVKEMRDAAADLRSMTMHSKRISLQLRRIAGSTFYGGDPTTYVQDVLDPIAAASAARRELLSNRQRETVSQAVQPLAVALSENLFDTREDTGLLLQALDSFPNTSSAVFHRNPYLHLTVRDEIDGSNFDVVITEADVIRIYPGYRASQAALARLSLNLSERFGANSISDLEEQRRVSVAELIS